MTNLNEELNVDVSQEETVQSSEPETTEEETVADTQEDNGGAEDTITLSKSEYTKLKRRAIAYKSLKENQPAPVKEKNGSSDINKDELYLIAKGYEEKDIEMLSVIAKGSGTSMREAVDSDLFKVYREKQQAEERKAKARLGASNGSGYNNPGPAVTPNMNEADHKAAWAKMMSGR